MSPGRALQRLIDSHGIDDKVACKPEQIGKLWKGTVKVKAKSSRVTHTSYHQGSLTVWTTQETTLLPWGLDPSKGYVVGLVFEGVEPTVVGGIHGAHGWANEVVEFDSQQMIEALRVSIKQGETR